MQLLLTAMLVAAAAPFVLAAPADYELIPGQGYYKLHTRDDTWQNAVNTCAAEGGHLLVINSEAEIEALYQKYQHTGMWVGVRRVDTDDNFRTIFGTTLESTGYAKWTPGCPRGDVTTWPYVGVSKTDGLYNLFTTVTLTFICEVEL